jgi:hypothetical protein
MLKYGSSFLRPRLTILRARILAPPSYSFSNSSSNENQSKDDTSWADSFWSSTTFQSRVEELRARGNEASTRPSRLYPRMPSQSLKSSIPVFKAKYTAITPEELENRHQDVVILNGEKWETLLATYRSGVLNFCRPSSICSTSWFQILVHRHRKWPRVNPDHV